MLFSLLNLLLFMMFFLVNGDYLPFLEICFTISYVVGYRSEDEIIGCGNNNDIIVVIHFYFNWVIISSLSEG